MRDYIVTLKIHFRAIKRFFSIIRLKYRVKRIKKRIYQEKEKIKVAFFVQYPEMWNSVKSIYEAMIDDEYFSVSIITFPKRIGVNTKEPRFFNKDDAKEFFASNSIESICAYNQGQWIDIFEISPDIIFIQRTYNEYLPRAFSLHRLSQVALLAYIPYSYQFGPGIHLMTEYNYNALNNLFLVFPESLDSYNYVLKKSALELKIGCREVYNLGFPRFDVLKQEVRENKKDISTFLWLPRWSDDSLYDKGNFLKYYKELISYFESNKNLFLIIRPHPLMFNNYINRNIMTEEEVEALKSRISTISNICFDLNFDYIETFKVSDVLIADFSGLLAEFFVTGKPIIYCGDKHSFTSDIGKKVYDFFYVSETSEELFENIKALTTNTTTVLNDEKNALINTILNGEEDSANRIISSIKKNLVRNSPLI